MTDNHREIFYPSSGPLSEPATIHALRAVSIADRLLQPEKENADG